MPTHWSHAALGITDFLMVRIAMRYHRAHRAQGSSRKGSVLDPERVMRVADALRRVASRHIEHEDRPTCQECHQPFPCRTIRDIAVGWADDPDYLEEWRPRNGIPE